MDGVAANLVDVSDGRSPEAELTVSRILRASSIAISGVGGAPDLTAFAASNPAITPSTTRITAIAKKPQK